MVSLTCPACAAEVKPDDLICFTCGANLPPRRPDEDPPAAATVMQEYLRREGVGGISPTGLRLAFPARNPPGPPRAPPLLRRAPAGTLVAPALAALPNRPRRHA